MSPQERVSTIQLEWLVASRVSQSVLNDVARDPCAGSSGWGPIHSERWRLWWECVWLKSGIWCCFPSRVISDSQWRNNLWTFQRDYYKERRSKIENGSMISDRVVSCVFVDFSRPRSMIVIGLRGKRWICCRCAHDFINVCIYDSVIFVSAPFASLIFLLQNCLLSTPLFSSPCFHWRVSFESMRLSFFFKTLICWVIVVLLYWLSKTFSLRNKTFWVVSYRSSRSHALTRTLCI